MTDFANPFGSNELVKLTFNVDKHIARENAAAVDLVPTNHTHSGSVYAITPGTVIDAHGTEKYFGLLSGGTWGGNHAIAVQGDDGHLYLYAHLNSNIVSNGQYISSGQHIGEMGWQGNVDPAGPDGAHLHIQIGENGRYTSSDLSIARELNNKIIHDGPWTSHSTSSHQTPATHPTTTNHSTPCQIKYSTDIHVKAIYKLHTYADNKCTIRNSYLIPELTQFWMIQDSNTGNYLVYTNNLPYFNQPVFLKHQVMTEQDVIATPDYGTK